MAYSDKVLDHYNNPRNVGSLDKASTEVGTGVVGAPECGDVMKLQIQVNGDGKIVDAKFKTYGCGSAIASSSLSSSSSARTRTSWSAPGALRRDTRTTLALPTSSATIQE